MKSQLGYQGVYAILILRTGLQVVQTAYAAGALPLTAAGAGGAAGTAGAAFPVLIVPASIVVPQELHPVETGAAAPHPQLGAAGAAQPQDRERRPHAGAAQPQDAAGAAQHVGAGVAQHVGAGAAQHVGAGAGQHVGAGAQHVGAPPQRLALFALSLASKPPPLHPSHPACFFAHNLAKRPSRPPQPPQSAIATDPKQTAKAANASEANRTLFIKIFLPRELNMDPRNATMYFLSYGPNLPETSLALRAATAAVVNLRWQTLPVRGFA